MVAVLLPVAIEECAFARGSQGGYGSKVIAVKRAERDGESSTGLQRTYLPLYLNAMAAWIAGHDGRHFLSGLKDGKECGSESAGKSHRLVW